MTDINAADYPPGLDVFPEGAYHLYDYMFFFTNLKENVAARTAAWSAGQEADIILSDDSSSFVLLSEAVPDAILEIRYYSTYNFVGDRIEGYEEPLEEEWWHFTLEDEPYPNTYFTFPINSDSLDDAA